MYLDGRYDSWENNNLTGNFVKAVNELCFINNYQVLFYIMQT